MTGTYTSGVKIPPKIQLNNIPIFLEENCRMKEPANVERLLNELVDGGLEKLQIVSDFDYTITKQRPDTGDDIILSSFGIFHKCKSIPEAYRVQEKILYNKYRPIEIDPHMTKEEKAQHMREWWTQARNLLTVIPRLDKLEMPPHGRASLNSITELVRSNCKINNRQNVDELINRLKKAGTSKLQVISDFDYTITKQRVPDGQKSPTSFMMFNQCKSLPQSYINAYNALDVIYRPLEIDPNVPVVQRVQYMTEWWNKTAALLTDFPFDPNEIHEVAYQCRHTLRDGTRELFDKLHKFNVPLLVFSAGLGDCVLSVLKQSGVYHPNVKVISNFLRYKENNLLDGLYEPIIHTFNKNESVLKGTDYYETVRDRDHVIVMGDSIGDSGMADGNPSSLNVLKIGFLYDHIEHNLSNYMDHFDIVLIDDQTMDVPRAILNLITQDS